MSEQAKHSLVISESWYKSNKRATFRWWQFWSGGPAGHIGFAVIGIPLGIALMLYLAGVTPDSLSHSNAVAWKAFRTAICAAAVWLGSLALAVQFARAHSRQALNLRVTDAGLILRAPMGEHLINWSSVKQIFQTTSNEYMICTARDGAFYFPSDQPWSSELLEQIQKRASVAPSQDLIAMQLEPHSELITKTPLYLLLIYLLFQYIKPIINGGSLTLSYALALSLFAIPALLIVGGLYYLALAKIPDVFRLGKNGIYVFDKNGESIISRVAIKRVRKFGNFVIVSTHDKTWFLRIDRMFDPNTAFADTKKLSAREKAKQTKVAGELLYVELNQNPNRISAR